MLAIGLNSAFNPLYGYVLADSNDYGVLAHNISPKDFVLERGALRNQNPNQRL